MFGVDEKKIKDFVHGYISIPKILFENFIDTPHFQRLRRIEQTSMRSLYPSARHDRFIHSLGTFHLGNRAIEYIKKNSDGIVLDESVYKSFLIACLLHDCGHAPFSHTFENYFGSNGDFCKRLKEITPGESLFHQDLDDSTPASPHEYLSALIVIRIYGQKIRELQADPVLVARMIIGATFTDDKPENALIELLNGRAIDVDKLDYVVRDVSIAGIKHIQVDIDRLLASILIKHNGSCYCLCFKKSALSAVNSVVEVKNFLKKWVFSHHIVQYEQEMLNQCVRELAEILYPSESVDISLSQLFDLNTYLQVETLPPNKIPMLCDDDLVHLMKIKNVPHVSEWMYRQYSMEPLWKSYYEFSRLLTPNVSISLSRIRRCLNEILGDVNNYIIIEQNDQHQVIEYHSLFVLMSENDICAYEDLFDLAENKPKKFFYLFIKKNLDVKTKQTIINKLKEIIH